MKYFRIFICCMKGLYGDFEVLYSRLKNWKHLACVTTKSKFRNQNTEFLVHFVWFFWKVCHLKAKKAKYSTKQYEGIKALAGD